MSPADALKAVHAAGVEAVSRGDDLVLEASAPPPAKILELLSKHKRGVAELLRPGRDDWLVPTPAERMAWEAAVAEWLRRNPVRSDSGRWHWCGESDVSEPLVQQGTVNNGHVWMHAKTCWPAWYDRHTVEAAAALRAMGVGSAREGTRDDQE